MFSSYGWKLKFYIIWLEKFKQIFKITYQLWNTEQSQCVEDVEEIKDSEPAH